MARDELTAAEESKTELYDAMEDAQFDYDHSVTNADFDTFGPILTEATEAYNAAVERLADATVARDDAITAEGVA